ncbi:MAG: GbsR/MarR family transcriptional regulator [Bacteroidia bacterium]
MARVWGVGRTMAEMFALLYVVEEPLESDQIMQLLQASRGSVSINLRKLLEWNLIHKVNPPGSRKEYYTAEKDAWNIALRIIQKRFEREMIPIEEVLYQMEDNLEPHSPLKDRLSQLQEVVHMVFSITQLVLPLLSGQKRDELARIIRVIHNRYGV